MPTTASSVRSVHPQRQPTLLAFCTTTTPTTTSTTTAASAATPAAAVPSVPSASTALASPAKATSSAPRTEGTGGCSSSSSSSFSPPSDTTPRTPAATRRRSRSGAVTPQPTARHGGLRAGAESSADEDDDDELRLADLLFPHTQATADASLREQPPVSRKVERDPFLSESPPTAPHAPPPPQQQQQRQHLTQTTLDLGQAHPGHTTQCPRCGMLYTAAADEDIALHRRFCRAECQRRRRQGWSSDVRRSSYAPILSSRTHATVSSAAAHSEASSTSAAAALVHGVNLLAALSDADVSHGLSRRRVGGSASASRARGGAGGQRSSNAARPTAAPGCSRGTVSGGSCGGELVELVTCTRLPVLVKALAGASSSGPALEVFHLRIDACRLASDGAATSADGMVSRTALSPATTHTTRVTALLEELGFTPALLLAVSPSDASSTARVAPCTDATMHVVCVVDALLQRLLAAVAGQARVREQDPELCLDERLDGSTLCSTRRHFTQGDVTGLWTCAPAEVSAAQAVWEKATVAPFSPARHTLQAFFGKGAMIRPVTGTAAASSPSTAAAASTGADDAMRAAEGRCQLALATALHGLAQQLVYGSALWPATQLSFADTALTAPSSPGRDAVEGALSRLAALVSAAGGSGTAVPTPRQDLSQAFSLYTHSAYNDEDDESETQETEVDALQSRRASDLRASSEDSAASVPVW